MLVIKDIADLRKYLETRRDMARNQKTGQGAQGDILIYLAYGFDEAIKAVDALLESMKSVPMSESEIISETLERR